MKKQYDYDDDSYPINDYLELNSISAHDCTGLIPSAITEHGEKDSYEELYPYVPPMIRPDKHTKNYKDIETNN